LTLPGAQSLLLAAGADPNAVGGPSRCTPLHLAAERGHSEMVRQLVAGGSRVDARCEANGETPLFGAAFFGYSDTCALLVELGADPCARDDDNSQPYLLAQQNVAPVPALALFSVCLSVYLSIYLSVCLSVCLSICLSVCLSVSPL